MLNNTKQMDKKERMPFRPIKANVYEKLLKIKGHFTQCLGRNVSITETVSKIILRFNIEENDCKDN